MMVHYTGNIYNFNIPPQKEDIIVDIPFFQQNPIKDEVLIQLEDKSVKDKESSQYKDITSINEIERKVIAKNGVSVKGQLKILAQLRADIDTKQHLICWSGIRPKRVMLEYILTLAWSNLLLETESTNVTLPQLIHLTHSYVAWEKTISTLINDHLKYQIDQYKTKRNCSEIDNDLVVKFEDKSIKYILQVVRHWFQYKVPKWLSTVSSLQQIVCNEKDLKPGDYSHFASTLENDFIPEHLVLLSEYGVPHSAIKKLRNRIPITVDDDNLISFIRNHDLHKTKSLIGYESDKIRSLY